MCIFAQTSTTLSLIFLPVIIAGIAGADVLTGGEGCGSSGTGGRRGGSSNRRRIQGD